ncbi:MAG: hypothetical protein GY694_17655 [Gammaproteobacteria bacterium]|nr:hypothetical protein [Gammaproteobacteria bacterium]
MNKNKPVDLFFFADGIKLGKATAGELRTDVMDQNVHRTGRCGFSFRIPSQYNIKNYRTLLIKAGSCKTIIASFQTDQIPEVVNGVLPKIRFMHIPKTA